VGIADAYCSVPTALGDVFVAYNDLGISAVIKPPHTSDPATALRATTGRAAYPAFDVPAGFRSTMEATLHGETRGRLKFDLRGRTAFERAVLVKSLEIPYGEIRPYGWIAREIGNPKAVRAVGTALAHNPIPLFIPCHRVVRTDGHIGNYGLGGRDAKITLLNAEGLDVDRIEALARAGIRYHGSDTTHIFCHPSCRCARRVSDAHRMLFASETAARLAGYRPCKVCRPGVGG
jgi:O-6-methylguanine DNA methyltransferase